VRKIKEGVPIAITNNYESTYKESFILSPLTERNNIVQREKRVEKGLSVNLERA